MDNKINKEAEAVQKLNKKRKVIAIFITVCVLMLASVVLVGMGFTWFRKSDSAVDVSHKVTDFSAAAKLSIDGGTTYTDHSNKTLIAKSNFANLRLNITYTGESDAYIRVKPFESFCDKDGKVLVKSDVSYTVDSKWVYNSADGYYYYKDIVGGASSSSPLSINFITGGASVAQEKITYESTDGFKMDLIIESVQPDRFKEFYGIEPESIIG